MSFMITCERKDRSPSHRTWKVKIHSCISIMSAIFSADVNFNYFDLHIFREVVCMFNIGWLKWNAVFLFKPLKSLWFCLYFFIFKDFFSSSGKCRHLFQSFFVCCWLFFLSQLVYSLYWGGEKWDISTDFCKITYISLCAVSFFLCFGQRVLYMALY